MRWALRFPLFGLCVVLLFTLASNQALAVVKHNVTFTVKSNGTVVASSDIGTFDAAGKKLTINESQLPSEMRRTTKLDFEIYKNDYSVNPVGKEMMSINNIYGYSAPVIYRVRELRNNSVTSYNKFNGNCMVDVSLWIRTDGKPLSVECKSAQYGLYNTSSRDAVFPATYLEFVFMEGAPSLAELKLPAGIYTFPTGRTRFKHSIQPVGGAWQIYDVYWDMYIKVVVEPSIAAVEMPNSLPLNVTMATANQLTGQGAVTASVSGALGKYLKIEPRSSNGGYLLKGAERIPYSLSVTPLSGDNTPRLLIDGNQAGAQPPVTIETFAKRDQYRLRFDAEFSTTTTGLSSGRFSDNVTLIFTTPDLP
ncbi:hypothetical protein [Aeromonas veronii]|uniref:hypothetical protein n=1 Tax=Aeromonas veronii TaxID=654 RepID=UPI003D25AC13